MIRLEHHVYLHFESPHPLQGTLDDIKKSLEALTSKVDHRFKEFKMTLDELKAKVEQNRNLGQSAVQLIRGLAQQIRDMANDPAKLQELADSIDADSADLAAAIQENTPTPPTS